jgi:protein-disulfide isomerase
MNRRPVGSARRTIVGVPAMVPPVLLVLLALAVTAIFAPSVLAQAPMSRLDAPPPPPNALPPNPAIDARVTTYMQKRFMIDDPSHIQLGPAVPTDMPGIYTRNIHISNDRGQSVSATMYTNQSEDQMLLSQVPLTIFDMTKDPWGKVDLKGIHLEDRSVMGPASAPVTIVEFADFECPFCARAFGTLETMVHSTYKDKIRVIYKNYPLNSHPWAIRAAIGAECARLQNPDTFWEFARDYYTNQGSITVKNIDDHIHDTAKRLNLDIPTLDACMAGKAAPARIAEDQKDGGVVGVTSTPTLFVNGIRIVGLPEEKAFEWVLSQQLGGASGGKEMLRQ